VVSPATSKISFDKVTFKQAMPLLQVVARHLVAVVLHVGLAGQTLCCLVLDIIQAIAASVRSRSRRCGISLAARNYFDGKTVWITGASSGIGRSVATELANLNATSTTRGSMRLVLMGRSPERLAPVQKTVEDRVSEVVCATVDMADAESVKTFVDRHGSTHCPDVVILCAGISQRSSCADLTMETLDTIMRTNFVGPVQLAKAAVPLMTVTKKMSPPHRAKGKARKNICVVSSVQGLISIPFRSGYSASKHALNAYFESLRAELSASLEHNVQVTIVSPGSCFATHTQF